LPGFWSWDTEAHDLELRTFEVTIRDRDGTVVAALPVADVKLSLLALLRGTVAPTAVELERARITLIRDANGDFRFGVGKKDTSLLRTWCCFVWALGLDLACCQYTIGKD
jgi:hypothetical protein